MLGLEVYEWVLIAVGAFWGAWFFRKVGKK